MDSLILSREVEIKSYLDRGHRWMGDTMGFVIISSKKSDLITLDKVNGPMAVNQSRSLFSKVPGMMIWENDGSGLQTSISSRGLSPNRSWEFNMRQNGFDISADPMGYPEAYYTPPLEAVERVEILRGASGIAFGPQVGGVVNYILKSERIDTALSLDIRQTFGSFGTYSNYLAAGKSVGKWRFWGYAQKRRAEGWRQNANYEAQHQHLYVGYQMNPYTLFSAEVTFMHYLSKQPGGLTDTQFATDWQASSRARNWMEIPWRLAKVGITQKKGNFALDLKVFGLLAERNSLGFLSSITAVDSVQFKRQADRDEYRNLGFEGRILQRFSWLKHKHQLGYGVRYFSGNTMRFQQGTGPSGENYVAIEGLKNYKRELDYTNANADAYIEVLWNQSGKWKYTTGIRLENIVSSVSGKIVSGNEPYIPNDQRKRSFIVYGGGVSYQALENLSLYSNFSTSYRPITFAELTPLSPLDVVDKNLKDATASNVDLGLRGTLLHGVQVDVSAYYLLYQNRIGRISAAGANQVLNIGDSQSRGIEASLDFDLLSCLKVHRNGWRINAYSSLAYNESRYITWSERAVAVSGSSLKGNAVEYAPKWIIRAGAQLTMMRWSIYWQMNYTEKVFTDAANTIVPSANAQVGLIPSYMLHDSGITFKASRQFTVKMDISNTFNVRYATRRSSGYPGPGLLPGQARALYFSLAFTL